MKHKFKVNFSAANIDGYTFKNVAIITADRSADGWGVWSDAKTLETALAAIEKAGGKVKAYLTHSREVDDELDIPGIFVNFRIVDGVLVADLEFNKSWVDGDPKNKTAFEIIKEVAAKGAGILGASIEASGEVVYVDDAGNEYADAALFPEGKTPVRDEPSFRVTDLYAVAIVANPAANYSLFAFSKRALAKKLEAALSVKQDIVQQPNDMKLFLKLQKKFGHDAKLLKVAFDAMTEEAAKPEAEQKSADEIIASVEEKAKADAAAALSAAVAEKDAKIAELTAKITELEAVSVKELQDKLAAAETAKAELEKKASELEVKLSKRSALPTDVDVGAAGSDTSTSHAQLMVEFSKITDPVARSKFYAEKIAKK